MKKKTALLFLAVAFVSVFAFSACSANKNDRIVVAKIDGKKITKSEYIKSWEEVKDAYGITQDILASTEYADQLDELRKSVLESLVSREITKTELENMGYYDLSQSEHDTVESETQSFFDSILSSKTTEMMAELGDDYSDKDYVKAVNKYTDLALQEIGYDREYIEEYYTYNLIMEKAESKLIDFTVTEDELQELFDQRVEEDKEFFSDLATYEYYTMQGDYVPYYVPEGIRMVRHVLIAFDDETSAKIFELRSSGKDEEADKLVSTSLEGIYEESMDVWAEIKNGTITFDTAILNYNDDPGMETNPKGYPMSLESVSYLQEFTDAGMALETVGDISDLVGTDYGYHILEYTSDVKSGPIDIDTVRQELNDGIIEDKRAQGWMDLIEEWTAKHDVEYFYENIAEEPQS